MKTIYGQCLTMKEISLSKATKILSKFAYADNGASEVVTAYLHRASSSFIELDNLHKELKSLRTHKKRNKSQPETGDEKSTHTKLNGSIGYEKGNVSSFEKQKKNILSMQESMIDGDSILKYGEREIDGKLTAAQDERKKKKKLKEGISDFSDNIGEFESFESEKAKGLEQQKEIDKKLSNNTEGENGGLVGPQDLQARKKKKYEKEEEVKMEGRKKRKNDDMERR